MLFSNLREYLSHIQLFHAHKRNFSIICGIKRCRRTFVKLHTFRKHISDWHSGDSNPTNYEEICEDEVNNSLNSNGGREDPTSAPNGDLEDENDSTPDDDENASTNAADNREENSRESSILMELQASSALFLMTIKEENKLPQTVLQAIIDGITRLNQSRMGLLEREIHRSITDAGLSPSSIPGLENIFNCEGYFGRPFIGLETQHHQLSFYKKNFNFIVRHASTDWHTH